MKIKIKKNLIFDERTKPLIIAEISGNHNQSKKKFLELIDKAHKNGADLVKIQTYEPQDLTIKSFTDGFKINKGIWRNQYLWNLYKKAHTPFRWHFDAFKLAKKKKINLFSTPFSKRGIDFLEKFNVPLYKISSFEIVDHKLIDLIAKTKKPIILSTGLSNIKEIKEAIKVINRYHNKVVIMHCVSEYPTKLENINFQRINKLKKIFKKNLIGVSDHTNNIYSSQMSLAFGVVAIEKHIKLSEKSISSDSEFSISLKNLNILRETVDSLYKGINSNGTFKLNKENKSSLIFRKSIFSIKDIKKDEVFSSKNLDTFRSKIGLSANNYFQIIGRRSKKNIKKFSPILKNHL
ncbi:pseudaminic acid synthase [Candidatus Pelagibacter bacterium]|nr:pseudaminic acid synthase [Candidatus Pelagibacter bacterium]